MKISISTEKQEKRGIRMVEKKETKEEKDINNIIFLRNYETNRI
jgi:hypothetical protein